MVELTPEERERIYLEEKARVDARDRLAAEAEGANRARAEERRRSARPFPAPLALLLAGVLPGAGAAWSILANLSTVPAPPDWHFIVGVGYVNPWTVAVAVVGLATAGVGLVLTLRRPRVASK